MLFILLTWCYIFLTTLSFGFLCKRVLGIKSSNFTIHHILGLFLYALLVNSFAFFYRINLEFYILILIINIGLLSYFFKEIKKHFLNLANLFSSLKGFYKILLIGIFVISLAQSATRPYLIDNESYYIQTIKWVNEYGLVKGLSNLHMFFGFYSGWHILQAGFNFPFLTDLFNDLTGYLMVIFAVFSVDKLNKYQSSKSKSDLFIGCVLVFSIFFMQFINAPSPDLAVFLISQLIFYIFMKNGKMMNSNHFLIVLSFILFLCLIKVTAVALALIPMFVFIKNYSSLKSGFVKYFILCSFVLLLFLLKNLIITGYIFYPFDFATFDGIDWKQPKELIEVYKHGTYITAFDNTEVGHLTLIDRFIFWLKTSKLHGLFNKLYILMLLLFPILLCRSKRKFEIAFIYFLAVIQFFIVWNSSAQYRYYFAFFIFLFVFGLISVVKKRTILNVIISLSIIISVIPLAFNFSLKKLSTNAFAMELSQFNVSNFVIPEGKSKFDLKFTKESIHGFEYNSPDDTMFFWGTGNGELPCINKQLIEYIDTYYHYAPQQRSDDLGDGFKSVKSN